MCIPQRCVGFTFFIYIMALLRRRASDGLNTSKIRISLRFGKNSPRMVLRQEIAVGLLLSLGM